MSSESKLVWKSFVGMRDNAVFTSGWKSDYAVPRVNTNQTFMNELRFEALPYDEGGTLRYTLYASNGQFSGFAELYQNSSSVRRFGDALTDFPQTVNHTVTLEYGDGSGEWPYHVKLRAQVMSNTGHSAISVRRQSFCSPIEAAFCEFLLPAEPAAINGLGRCIAAWSLNPVEAIVWQPKS